MDVINKYNQEKETIIQYDLSDLLHIDLSDSLKSRLDELENGDVTKFVALFPIQSRTRIAEIKDSLKGLKDILPYELFEDTKDEVKDTCDDYKWINSRDGKKILQIEEWIKKARYSFSTDFPSELIYIGRSFINPISLIVGGYVKGNGVKEFMKSYFDNINPPIDIEYRITEYETD